MLVIKLLTIVQVTANFTFCVYIFFLIYNFNKIIHKLSFIGSWIKLMLDHLLFAMAYFGELSQKAHNVAAICPKFIQILVIFLIGFG